ncbi:MULTISPECIES: WhiB family transcriptional regulator [Streptomyces]|uniref:Transcriptional regulator WhiB n=1 Tax=Streptomyces vietnamensis TaxID=362257 RepID=A0A0B5IPT2_9ACTN|nr:WhiB family transcriptional regulator [Streptomyces vietnamensis]AJF70434.1 WhiB family transcriptional regulator [Streptomyces vietnamensis]
MKYIVVTSAYAPTSTAVPERPRPACAGQDPDIFFPEGDLGPTLPQLTKAKQICARCPLIHSCLQGALERGEEHGVWGGLSTAERHELTARRAPGPLSVAA